jgi:MoaA/NifB/PqqE/SkfB family radical SAM enzyme
VSALTKRARTAAERLLSAQAGTVRRVLLAAGRDRAPRWPDIVQIESTNLCNAKCVFCPRDEMERRQGVMSMELFQKVVDECASLGITHVRVHNYGEPFLDKRLVEKVRYAKARGIAEVGMISNGSLITEPVARAMVEAGLDAINISVDAGNKASFERTRVHLKYDTVVNNIRTLARIRNEQGRRRPRLILSFVRQDDPADEEAFMREWGDVADKIHVTELHNWAGTLHTRSNVRFPCYRLWLTFTVLWDGRVSLCCADFDGHHVLGDLKTQSIAEIWNSPAYRAARREQLETGGPAICRSCDLPKKDSPLWVTRLAGSRSPGV